jgi:transposase-like protein
MIQAKSDQDRFTVERVLRTRPKTYRAIVQLLADPSATVMHIAKRHRVSEHTVRAIRAREAAAIAERKQRLMSIFANVAEISAERMEELAGKQVCEMLERQPESPPTNCSRLPATTCNPCIISTLSIEPMMT